MRQLTQEEAEKCWRALGCPRDFDLICEYPSLKELCGFGLAYTSDPLKWFPRLWEKLHSLDPYATVFMQPYEHTWMVGHVFEDSDTWSLRINPIPSNAENPLEALCEAIEKLQEKSNAPTP